MIFVFHLLDRPGAQALRNAIRPQHKEYLARVAAQIAFAGPLLSDDGQQMIGSLLAIDFDSRETAARWQQDEPFSKAGLYACVSVHAFSNLWPQRCGFPLS